MPASGTPLDPRLVSLLEDVQWLLYRTFSVMSRIVGGGVPPADDAWRIQLPVYCMYLHAGGEEAAVSDEVRAARSVTATSARCAVLRNTLAAKGVRRISRGRCAAGLALLAVPLRAGHRRFGCLMVGPFARRAPSPVDVRRVARQEAFDRDDALRWAARQVPVLSPAMERSLIEWLARVLAPLLARYGPLHDGASWEQVIGQEWDPVRAPVRIADDPPASLFDVWGWPFSGRPVVYREARQHVFWELVYVECGSLAVVAGGIRLDLVPGRACLLPPDSLPAFDPSAGTAGVQLHLAGHLGVFAPLAGRVLDLDAHQREDLRELCAGLFRPAAQARAAPPRLKLLTLLFSLAAGPAAGARAPIGSPAELERRRGLVVAAKTWLEARLGEPVLLHALAQACKASPSTLSHAFKAAVGVSPLQYHTRLRMERARTLLREGRLPVAQIAADLGYADGPHFSRAFKRAAGASPRAFGRRVRPVH